MVLYCQADSTKQEPYVYFNAVSVIAGFSGTESQLHNTAYFKQLAPANSIAQLAPDSAANLRLDGNTGNAMLNFGINIHLKTKDFKTKLGRFSSEWRLGLNIATNLRERYTLKQEITQRTDTFYSNHTNMVKYEKTVSENIYQYSYKSKNVYLDISKTYHTDQLKRFSFYTGINVRIGYTFGNRLSATIVNDSTMQYRRRLYYLEKWDGAVTETTKLNPELYYNATIPIGIVLRKTSKKKQVAYPFSFFAEARLGYRFQKGLNGAYNPIPLGTFMIGTKMYFHKQKTN